MVDDRASTLDTLRRDLPPRPYENLRQVYRLQRVALRAHRNPSVRAWAERLVLRGHRVQVEATRHKVQLLGIELVGFVRHLIVRSLILHHIPTIAVAGFPHAMLPVLLR